MDCDELLLLFFDLRASRKYGYFYLEVISKFKMEDNPNASNGPFGERTLHPEDMAPIISSDLADGDLGFACCETHWLTSGAVR
jgi:hypothetical protein